MHTAAPSHPSTAELGAFSLGQVSDTELDSIATHLAGCSSCCALLDQLNVCDGLLARLQDSDSRLHLVPEHPSQCRTTVPRLGSRLRSQEIDTPVSDPHQNEAAADLGFLGPASRSGSLGRLGHFEVLEVLGRGGFGVVLRAFDERLQRAVALKVLAPELAATASSRQRFLREARAAAQVRHENVVQIYAIVEQPRPYLVMELVPGETLQQRLDRAGRFAVAEVVAIGRQLAEGLAAAHSAGLVHRDIKLANILIEESPLLCVKITDFGLAQATNDARLTQSGLVVGTPMFMSPEQAWGNPLDHRTDLFSLGSVLYALTTGQPPFRADNPLVVLQRVTEAAPQPIPELVPETPAWLCHLITRLMARVANERPQTAAAVAEELAAGKVDSQHPRAGGQMDGLAPIGSPKTEVHTSLPAEEQGQVAPRRATWPHRLLWATGVSTLVAVMAWTTYPFTPSEPDPEAQVLAPGGSQPAVRSPPKTYTNSLGMHFRLIPAGQFTMGSPPDEIQRCLRLTNDPGLQVLIKSEGPKHDVQITQPFYLGETEVTYGQFRQFAGEDPARGADPARAVVRVSWQEAVKFCTWLSEKEGKTYRLPTEAEWEYACRAGRNHVRYGFGDDDAAVEDHAWYQKNSGGWPQPVGGKKPNAWGLHDMHGNVWELCQDHFDLNSYRHSPTTNPRGPGTGTQRVMRGGSWFQPPEVCRAASRTGVDPNIGSHDVGFRVVLEVSSGRATAVAGPALSLLPLLDVKRDCVDHQWKLEGGVLTPPAAPATSRLQLPYLPPAEYDLSLCAERRGSFPTLLIGLVVGGRQVVVVLDGWEGKVSGLNLINGKDAHENASRVDGALLPVGAPFRIDCSVRANRLTVAVQGIQRIAWQGNPTVFSLAPWEAVPNPNCLFLHNNSYILTDLSVRPLPGPGRRFDPMRVAANGVLRQRDGQIVIIPQGGHPVEVNQLADLPDRDFHLTTIRASVAGNADRLTTLLPERLELQRLALDHTGLTAVGVSSLSRLARLEELSVVGTPLTDADLTKFGGLPGLQRLRVGWEQFSAPALQQFAQRLPGCRVQQLSPDHTAARTVLALGGSVHILDRNGTYRAITKLADLPEEESFRLLELRWRHLTPIPPQHFRCLRNLADLRFFGSWYSGINDACVRHWKDLPRLESVQLGTSQLTAAGLEHLSGFPSIRRLNLNLSTCDAAGVAWVAKLAQLETLTLWQTPVTDAALEPLSRLHHLKELDIRATKITPAGAQRLREALPGCQIQYP